MECVINDKTYTYEVWISIEEPKTIYSFSTNDKDLDIDYHNYNKLEWLLEDIKEDVISRGGRCE